MNPPNRNLILVIASVLGFFVVLGVGLYVTFQQNTQTQNAPFTPDESEKATETTQDPTEESVTSDLYITNIQFLGKWFNEFEYLFINDAVLNHGYDNFAQVDGFVIDETSFNQETSNKYSFGIRDTNNNQLFYVIVVRTADGQLNINFYNS